MLTKIHAALFLLIFFMPTLAGANENSVKSQFQNRFQGLEVQSVTKTSFPGIYEVVVRNQIFYTDEGVNYVFRGALIDAKSQRNLTEERLRKITGIPFEKLPLNLAIKLVKGNGKRKAAIFEDPDCPYCKKLEQETLPQIDDVTLYIFLYPIEQLHAGATEKSKKIWCSPNPGKAWTDVMLKGIQPTAAPTCNNPVDALQKFAREHNITGTPTLIFANGRRVAGALPTVDLERLLDNAP